MQRNVGATESEDGPAVSISQVRQGVQFGVVAEEFGEWLRRLAVGWRIANCAHGLLIIPEPECPIGGCRTYSRCAWSRIPTTARTADAKVAHEPHLVRRLSSIVSFTVCGCGPG
jgi:hypothetical protein